jgi:hypothetical protein
MFRLGLGFRSAFAKSMQAACAASFISSQNGPDLAGIQRNEKPDEAAEMQRRGRT